MTPTSPSQPPKRSGRIYVRVPVRLHVAARDQVLDAVLYFVTRDLSVGGVFLESDLLFEPGTELELFFQLPGTQTPCRVQGRVVWTRDDEEGQPPGMGVGFRGMDWETRKVLSTYVQRRAGRVRESS